MDRAALAAFAFMAGRNRQESITSDESPPTENENSTTEDENSENSGATVSEESASKTVVPPLIAAAFTNLLYDAVDQLELLGSIANFPTNVEQEIVYKTPHERFSKMYKTHIYDPSTIEPVGVALSKQKLVKFQKDRLYVEKVMGQVIYELQKSRSFDGLLERLEEHKRSKEDEEELLQEAKDKKKEVRNLKKMLDNENGVMKDKIRKINEEIGRLKDEIEELTSETKIKHKYIQGWENSRIEMNQINLLNQEEYYSNQIKSYTSEIEREERVHTEVELFLIETMKEYEEQILVWMEKYDQELEEKETDIQVLKEKREEQFIKLENLAKLYDKHKIEIEEYLVVREKRRQEQEKFEKMVQATLRIQSWWRGIMVRKCLGPYRKKKPKKGKGNKKGKK